MPIRKQSRPYDLHFSLCQGIMLRQVTLKDRTSVAFAVAAQEKVWRRSPYSWGSNIRMCTWTARSMFAMLRQSSQACESYTTPDHPRSMCASDTSPRGSRRVFVACALRGERWRTGSEGRSDCGWSCPIGACIQIVPGIYQIPSPLKLGAHS
ncbi:hypothetical protein BS17DRAFT_773591 [Gyrodon lividus]|nr:hypothetical protein BS17DRAFT_773591 [Gyrodon lividus]